MREFGSEFVNKISDKYSIEGWAEKTPFGESSEDVDCMVCGNARVENSELNFMEPSPEMSSFKYCSRNKSNLVGFKVLPLNLVGCFVTMVHVRLQPCFF